MKNFPSLQKLKLNQALSQDQHLLSQNIIKNYLHTLLTNLSLTDAIWMLYLAFRGMSLVEIGLLESIFHITGLFMEIPTGIVADRYGRRTSRILGRGLAIVATTAMLFAKDFWSFALAFVVSALSYNLESGAGDALVYDSLLATNQAENYMKVKGRSEFFYQSARIISLVIGGWLATFSYTLGYSIAIGVNVITFLWAFTFVEPALQGSGENALDGGVPSEKPLNLIQHVQGSIAVIKAHKHIMYYIIFLESFSFFQTTLYFYSQNFFKGKGYNEGQIGLLLALAGGLGILFSLKAHSLEGYFGRRRLIGLAAAGTLLALAALAFLPYEPLAFMVLACLDGLIFVTFSDYINQLIPSVHRATLLSFEAMVFSLLMILGFPIVGWIAQGWGFKIAFLALFIIAIPSMGLNYLRLYQRLGSKA